MSSRPTCRWSSSASIRAAGPPLRLRILRIRGTTSGGCSTTPASPRASTRLGLTNAAYRTTPGSGDLRRADFKGSAERLEQVATELRPRWLAFVGKEAYRGAFRERPELGVQERRLGESQLFVLPSTSPANAAVPYAERLRWFRELRELAR